MNNDELMHYGVLGMKWGHRKRVSANPTASGKKRHMSSEQAYLQMQKAKSIKKKANKQFNKAYRHDNSLIRRSQFDKADNKRSANQLAKAASNANSADKKYKAAKKAYKTIKKHEKVNVKDIKQKYSKQYLSGKSKVGKVMSKIAGTDKAYANTMYDMNKRAKVNKTWRD